MRKMVFLINTNKSVWLYVVFGIATTGANIAGYYLCSSFFHLNILLSNILAWLAAVLFAYTTNRKWVFESKNTEIKLIVRESVIFFACRLATGIMDMVIMILGIDILKADDMVIKIISNVIVIFTNYFASKFIVFV